MNRKISRNKKHKYSNKEKLALVENENKHSNKYCPGGWQQHVWIVTKIRNKQSSICHLKMFQTLFKRYFCFYFTFTVYTNVLNTVVFMVKKGKEKAVKSQPLSWLSKLSVFPTPLLFPSTQLLVFDIFSNYPYYSTPFPVRHLRTPKRPANVLE